MEILEQVVGVLVLAPLMFVVGLQLTPDDFRHMLAAPRAVIGGTLGQLILLPLMTLALVFLFPVTPYIAAGALLVAATPGAGMSNVMAAVSRANVALSVTLTAFASLLSIATIPAAVALGYQWFTGGTGAVELPVGRIVLQLVFSLAIPIGLGMLMRARRPATAQRYVSRGNRFAVIAIIVLTLLGALNSDAGLPEGTEIGRAAVAATLWTLAAMAIGFTLGTLLRLSADDRFTFVIEFGARNMALALVVAVASVGSIDLALFGIAYTIAGSPIVLLLALARGRWLRSGAGA